MPLPKTAKEIVHVATLNMSNVDYKKGLKNINADTVKTAMEGYPSYRVLDSRSPQVAEEERRLPRTTRIFGFEHCSLANWIFSATTIKHLDYKETAVCIFLQLPFPMLGKRLNGVEWTPQW